MEVKMQVNKPEMFVVHINVKLFAHNYSKKSTVEY